MKRTLVIAAGLLALLSQTVCALSEPDKTEPTGSPFWPSSRERGVYHASIADSGKLLWKVDWETTVSQKGDDKVHVQIVEQGAGQPYKYDAPIRWEKKMVLSGGQFESVEGTRWTKEGKILSRMDVRADPARGKISYYDWEGKSSVSKTLKWTPQSFPDELLFHWIRTLPFEQLEKEQKQRQEPFTLIVGPSRQFKINALFDGRERVKTPAGTFECYRIDLVPQLFGPLKKLAPEMSIWCAIEAPHYWVRYTGPVGGPGSPQAVIELVKFEQESPQS
jgi:hypothetical protein